MLQFNKQKTGAGRAFIRINTYVDEDGDPDELDEANAEQFRFDIRVASPLRVRVSQQTVR